MIRLEALDGEAAVAFLRHVRRCVGRKLLVVWDGRPFIAVERCATFWRTVQPDTLDVMRNNKESPSQSPPPKTDAQIVKATSAQHREV
jgi:hypothetical protein